jgi:hypothetical protein
MERLSLRLLLSFGILLASGCGARSPLDLQEDEDWGSGGIWSNGGRGGNAGVGAGGSIGFGGSKGSGGMHMGGMMMSGGRPGTGGTMLSGGRPGTGGTILSGGRPGTGGSVLSGGRGGNAGGRGGSAGVGGRAGGAGGRAGGAGGMAGGAGGMAGGAGGMAGGAGGLFRTGGTLGSGGVRPTGGTIGAGGSAGAGGSLCPALAPNEELIDDLNDGDRFIPPLSGRSGAWTNRVDGSPSAKIFPDPATGFVPSATGDVCRKYAAYVYGSGCVLSGCSFWFGLGSPYDASKYTGITFWAKIDAGTSEVLRLAFPDKDTEPVGNLCETDPPAGSTNGCWDHYSELVTLTTTWTKHTVSFSNLEQGGWGRPGTAFDPATLYKVEFDIPVNATFGIWIDDVAFTR